MKEEAQTMKQALLARKAYIYQAYRSNDAPDFRACVNEILHADPKPVYAATDTFSYGARQDLTYADAQMCAAMIEMAIKHKVNLPEYFFDRLVIRP